MKNLKLKSGWFQLFNIYNNSDTLRIIIFGIKISIKMNTYKISNFINNFINKFIVGGVVIVLNVSILSILDYI